METSTNPSKSLNVWLPDQISSGETNHLSRISLINHNIKYKYMPNDYLGRLKNTWLNNIYQKYFKQSSIARGGVNWLWRQFFPVYIKALDLLSKIPKITKITKIPKIPKKKPLTQFSIITNLSVDTRYDLISETVVETTIPTVFPSSAQHNLNSKYTHYLYPKIFVATIQKAMTYGGSNLIHTRKQVLCHDMYNFNTDYTSEELHGYAVIYPETQSIRWMVHDTTPAKMPIAATFVDSCALNYAHWITEVLPRICLFCSDIRFKNIPIIINDGVHKNLIESLLLVCGDRDIFSLPIGRALTVDKLYLISPTGYIPFEKRAGKFKKKTSPGLFSPHALKMLCDRLNNTLPIHQHANFPKKIYLRRSSSTRKLLNESDIEALLVMRGFSIIATEQLNFAEQVMLFQNAEVIIGATGAACANLIFSKPSTNIVILMGIHKNMPYRYWLHLANAAGIKKISYILGQIVQNKNLDFHGDYQIATDDLLSYLNTLEN